MRRAPWAAGGLVGLILALAVLTAAVVAAAALLLHGAAA